MRVKFEVRTFNRVGAISNTMKGSAICAQIHKSNKWRAVAAQTARYRSKVLSIQLVRLFLGTTKGSGTEDKSFAEMSGK